MPIKLVTLFNNQELIMKRFVYIITDRNRQVLNVGRSADLLKTIEFYRQMPELNWSGSDHGSRLVYFEELQSESAAMERFQMLNHFTRAQKERLIRDVNADWLDLGIALDYERMLLNEGINFPLNIKKAA